MKYDILKLDGRFTYRNLFAYCIKFSNRMANSQGPQHFNDVMQWFTATYGWSAEVRQYDNMMKWVEQTLVFGKIITVARDLPDCCNEYWSWTNGYDDLRIYVRSDAELNFFQLRWPNEPRST